MKTLLITLAFGLVLGAQPYGARGAYGDRGGYPDRGAYGYRSNNFAARIAHGERMGLLTRREADRLWKMERDLRRDIDRAARSGFGINGRERERIARKEARLDYEIRRQMRDRERYGPGPGRW
jgi:hypothetical protein